MKHTGKWFLVWGALMMMTTMAMAASEKEGDARQEIILLDGRTLVVKGDEAFTTNAKGVEVPALDGEYVASNGKLTFVQAGKVIKK